MVIIILITLHRSLTPTPPRGVFLPLVRCPSHPLFLTPWVSFIIIIIIVYIYLSHIDPFINSDARSVLDEWVRSQHYSSTSFSSSAAAALDSLSASRLQSAHPQPIATSHRCRPRRPHPIITIIILYYSTPPCRPFLTIPSHSVHSTTT